MELPTELIDEDKLFSPNSMTDGLLPQLYWGLLNFFSANMLAILILVIVLGLCIVIIGIGKVFAR
jgi:hypothetical protein